METRNLFERLMDVSPGMEIWWDYDNTLELWICDLTTSTTLKAAEDLNFVFGDNIRWLPDNQSLVYLAKAPGMSGKPVRSNVSEGPVVQENLGSKAQAEWAMCVSVGECHAAGVLPSAGVVKKAVRRMDVDVRQLLGGSCFLDATRFTQEQRTLHA